MSIRRPLVKEVTQMGDNRFIPWMAITLSGLAVAIMVLVIFFPAIERYELVSPGGAFWVLGALALLVTVTGFLAFTTPQSKAAAVGGLLLLIAIILVTPVAVKISPGSPNHLE